MPLFQSTAKDIIEKLTEAHSIGKAFYQTIKPAPVFQEQGWKRVLGSVLEYYDSKKLDRMAKAAFKRYKIAGKAAEAL